MWGNLDYIIYLSFITIICLFLYKIHRQKVMYKKLQDKFKLSVKEVLSLSTGEQLLKEIRKRKNVPFILLFPVKEEEYNGIMIESHSINTISCLAMLHLAKSVMSQNIREKGEKVPRFPSFKNYFDS